MSELVAVPIRKGSAPYRSRLTSQTVLVKKPRPLCWIAGHAGVIILSRIQSRVSTAATEASQVRTMKRSGRFRILPVSRPANFVSLSLAIAFEPPSTGVELLDSLQCFEVFVHD